MVCQINEPINIEQVRNVRNSLCNGLKIECVLSSKDKVREYIVKQMKKWNEDIRMLLRFKRTRSLNQSLLLFCSVFSSLIMELSSGKFSNPMIKSRFYHISSVMRKMNWVKSGILEQAGAYKLKVNYLFSYRAFSVEQLGPSDRLSVDRGIHLNSVVSTVCSPNYELGNVGTFYKNVVIVGHSFNR